MRGRLTLFAAAGGLLLTACGSSSDTVATAPPVATETTVAISVETTTTTTTMSTTLPAPPEFPGMQWDRPDVDHHGYLTIFNTGGEVDVEVWASGDRSRIEIEYQDLTMSMYMEDRIAYRSDGGPYIESTPTTLDYLLSELTLFSASVDFVDREEVAGVQTTRWSADSRLVAELLGAPRLDVDSRLDVWVTEGGFPLRMELVAVGPGLDLSVTWNVDATRNITFATPGPLPEPTGVLATQDSLRDVMLAGTVYLIDNGSYEAPLTEFDDYGLAVQVTTLENASFGSVGYLGSPEDLLAVSQALDGTYWCLARDMDGFVTFGSGSSLADVDEIFECQNESWPAPGR